MGVGPCHAAEVGSGSGPMEQVAEKCLPQSWHCREIHVMDSARASAENAELARLLEGELRMPSRKHPHVGFSDELRTEDMLRYDNNLFALKAAIDLRDVKKAQGLYAEGLDWLLEVCNNSPEDIFELRDQSLAWTPRRLEKLQAQYVALLDASSDELYCDRWGEEVDISADADRDSASFGVSEDFHNNVPELPKGAQKGVFAGRSSWSKRLSHLRADSANLRVEASALPESHSCCIHDRRPRSHV